MTVLSVDLRIARFAALAALAASCQGAIITHPDPLDGALDSTVIAIVEPDAPDTFRVDEVFLGDVAAGETLRLPRFQLTEWFYPDPPLMVGRASRVYLFSAGMRILLFLRPVSETTRKENRFGAWTIGEYGDCYFWTRGSTDLNSLREMASRALDWRRRWEAALNLTDEHSRTAALWSFLWTGNQRIFEITRAELERMGPVAGNYFADQWPAMDRGQREALLFYAGRFHSARLHAIVLDDLKEQRRLWDAMARRYGPWAKLQTVVPPRMNDYSRSDTDADEGEFINGELYHGFSALADFADRDDLPFIRESALWAVKYRFRQVDDAALEAFRAMPDSGNLPVIRAIWKQYSARQFTGNELKPYYVMRALDTQRFPETIPFMAEFVNAGFAQEIARAFLVEMTGQNFGGDTAAWKKWYAANFTR